MGEQTQAEKQQAKHQPSGPKGDSPATAGAGETKVKSETPENAAKKINPSAPNDGITPPLQ